ncbi:hypothetical protein CC80DRAFT_539100 [Byssothecium circinans]|uniref:non-specific serine/threonine protein kinase n=1 Tax=Byssothecium circinans TaxID=147558 RepID=A0A6A5THS7_9PLEO|nr:hypothetical protein CC80DRAFT_539100 [Byssothecium circinans]
MPPKARGGGGGGGRGRGTPAENSHLVASYTMQFPRGRQVKHYFYDSYNRWIMFDAKSGIVPEWDSRVVPADPYTWQQRIEAKARFESGKQTDTDPFGDGREPEGHPQEPAVSVREAPPMNNLPYQDTYPLANNPAHQDTYPPSFMMPAPWHEDPDDSVLPPGVWEAKYGYDADEEPEEYGEVIEDIKREWLKTELGKKFEDETQWQGVKFLGKGAYGSAGLWVKTNDEGCIIDRLVVKEARLRPEQWFDSREWREQRPKEITMHRKIESTRNAEDNPQRSLVRYRGYCVMMTQQRYKIYLGYCAKGSLYTALEGKVKDTKNHVKCNKVPEAFIWYLLEELAEACAVLQQGHVDRPVEGWRPLVHADLFYSNVFLDEREPKEGDGILEDLDWPQPVLGDFGRMFYELNTDPDAPWHERDNHQLTDMNIQELGNPKQEIRITGKADVWAIVNVAWLVATYRDSSFVKIDGHKVYTCKQDFDEKLMLANRCLRGRSERLKKVFARCLRHKPNDRCDLVELRKMISDAKADPALQDQLKYEDTDMVFGNDWNDYAIGSLLGKRRRAEEGSGNDDNFSGNDERSRAPEDDDGNDGYIPASPLIELVSPSRSPEDNGSNGGYHPASPLFVLVSPSRSLEDDGSNDHYSPASLPT